MVFRAPCDYNNTIRRARRFVVAAARSHRTFVEHNAHCGACADRIFTDRHLVADLVTFGERESAVRRVFRANDVILYAWTFGVDVRKAGKRPETTRI